MAPSAAEGSAVALMAVACPEAVATAAAATAEVVVATAAVRATQSVRSAEAGWAKATMEVAG